MVTAALLIIPLVHFVGRQLENPRIKSILQTVVIASAGLLLAAVISLARGALTNYLTIAIAVATVLVMLLSDIDTLRIILSAAMASLCAFSIGIIWGVAAGGELSTLSRNHCDLRGAISLQAYRTKFPANGTLLSLLQAACCTLGAEQISCHNSMLWLCAPRRSFSPPRRWHAT
jgi:chromate transport protein ChrA